MVKESKRERTYLLRLLGQRMAAGQGIAVRMKPLLNTGPTEVYEEKRSAQETMSFDNFVLRS